MWLFKETIKENCAESSFPKNLTSHLYHLQFFYFIVYKNKILYGLTKNYICFIEYIYLAAMINNPESYKNKNRLRTFEPENSLKNKNAEPHLKKLFL